MSTDRRDYVVSFRVTEEQWGRINKAAEAEGLQRADYCRSVLVGPRLLERMYLLTRGMAERQHLLVRDTDTAQRQAVERSMSQLIEEVEAEEG